MVKPPPPGPETEEELITSMASLQEGFAKRGAGKRLNGLEKNMENSMKNLGKSMENPL